jgi:hypothetical protein
MTLIVGAHAPGAPANVSVFWLSAGCEDEFRGGRGEDYVAASYGTKRLVNVCGLAAVGIAHSAAASAASSAIPVKQDTEAGALPIDDCRMLNIPWSLFNAGSWQLDPKP